MADWVTSEVSVDTVRIPTPPVRFSSRTIPFPTIGPYRFPSIRFGPFRTDLPTVAIPRVSFRVPDVSVGWDREPLPSIGPIPIPDVRLPFLDIDTRTETIPLVNVSVRVVDPWGSRLRGGDVDLDLYRVGSPGSVFVPDVDVSHHRVRFGGQRYHFPDVEIPRLSVSLPDIGRINLPDVRVPTRATLTGTVAVPDPTSLAVSVGVEWPAVRAFALEPVAEWATSSDPADLLDAVLSAVESNLTAGLLRRATGIVEGALQLALAEETKQDLREQARE